MQLLSLLPLHGLTDNSLIHKSMEIFKKKNSLKINLSIGIVLFKLTYMIQSYANIKYKIYFLEIKWLSD